MLVELASAQACDMGAKMVLLGPETTVVKFNDFISNSCVSNSLKLSMVSMVDLGCCKN